MLEKPRRQELYNLLNPDESLTPDDARNLDVDAFRIDEKRVHPRGAVWVDELAGDIELSNDPVCEFFTGLPGSGKSTELRRLAAALRELKSFVVRVDTEDLLDLREQVDIADVLCAVVYQTNLALIRERSPDAKPEAALTDGPFLRLWSWVTHTDVSLAKVDGEVGAEGVKVKGALQLKTNPTLRQQVRTRVAEMPGEFIRQVREEMAELLESFRARGHESVTVIVDSLEKLHGTNATFTEVLTSAERLFSSGAPDLKLPVHTVYTLPPALVFRLNIPVHFLPMLKVRGPEGDRDPDGFKAARALVGKRLTDADLSALFGADFEAALGRLIDWSAGYPRELVRLLQKCVKAGEVSDLEKLLTRAGAAFRRTVTDTTAVWLASVAHEKRAVIEDEETRDTADLAMRNSVVLRYMNGDEWYDVHPAIESHPRFRDALARLGRGSV